MKKILLLVLSIVTLSFSESRAQDKKVAVVTFFINKKIDASAFGAVAFVAVNKLSNDPAFNLSPILQEFHDQFFESYAQQFPFQLIPEADVLNNAGYKAYNPFYIDTAGMFDATKYLIPFPGYKIVLHVLGTKNEQQLLTIFNQADGVMDVSIDFKLVKIGFGGMGVVKVMAEANIKLVNKAGDKVFSINEDDKSTAVSPMVAGIPVMTPEKILPLCESAMDELMKDLQKDLPKMIRKTDAKL